MKIQNIVLPVLISILLVGCSTFSAKDENSLTRIHVITPDGISETISHPERLKQYQNIDFLKPQPYQKVVRLFGRDAQGVSRAIVTSYYSNGQAKQYLEVVNNQAHGRYLEWYQDGQRKLEAFIISGSPDLSPSAEKSWHFDGIAKAWDEKGYLIANIPYQKGELAGVSLYFHPNGKVFKRVPFHRGKIEGTFEMFSEDGSPLETCTYSEGQKNGASFSYWMQGQIASEEMYNQGRLQTGQYYRINGTRIAEVKNGEGQKAVFNHDDSVELQEFHAGKQNGKVEILRGDQPHLIYHIKDGVKHGLETEYYPKTHKTEPLRPLISINWYEGKIQGQVKTWYPNGVVESQKEMSDNKKNGILTSWYSDGSLMLIEEYDYNKLLKGQYLKKGDKQPVSQVVGGKGVATLFDVNGNLIRKIRYNNGEPE